MQAAVCGSAILDQPGSAASNAPEEEVERTRKHKRNLDLALQHAFLIQHRKDVEAQILVLIEELADIPESAHFTQQEALDFTSKISIFQPSDFDDLIAERIAQSRCGYVLCGQKPRSSTMRVWNLAVGAGDFCSSSCQMKAAYVRAQLNPIPAWERSPSQHVEVVLQESQQAISKQVKQNPNAELAFERGEKASSRKPQQVMTAEVIEKTTKLGVHDAAPPGLDMAANAIEGYTPKVLPSEDDIVSSTLSKEPPSHDEHQGSDDEEQQWNDMFEHLQKR